MRKVGYRQTAVWAVTLTIMGAMLAPARGQDYSPQGWNQPGPGPGPVAPQPWQQPGMPAPMYPQQPPAQRLPPVSQASYPEVMQASATDAVQPGSYLDLQRRLEALEAKTAADAMNAAVSCKEVPIQTAPSYKFRGQLFFDDLAVESTPTSGPLPNFTGLRDLRLGVEGNIYENLKYVLEVQFNPIRTLAIPVNSVRVKDAYGEFSQLPWVGYLRIGHFKEPDGLEQNVSDKFTTFMERSEATTAFTPARKDGLMIYDTVGEGQDFSWFAGVFRGDTTDDDVGVSDSSSDLAVTARAVWLPYFDDTAPGRGVLHLGGCVSSRHAAAGLEGNGDLRPTFELDSYRTGLRARLLNDEEFMQYGTEFAYSHGPFSLQNEFFFLATGQETDVRTWGTYVEASYFLTGENRGYNKVMKVYDRVVPYEPFFAVRTANGVCRGWGAWQLAARWSFVDLDTNGTLQSSVLGSQSNVDLGVNWYLNPYSRVMVNYVHGVTSPASGAANQLVDDFGVRFQIDW